MQFGVSLFTCDRGITPAATAQAAEAAGFDAVYVPEHTHIPVVRQSNHPGTGTETIPDDRYFRTLDPWVSLASAASVTERIRLGTSVALPLEHDPIALAKTIASLDHLSGGRVTFGVGFGWNLEELADHGVPPRKRRTALRDYLAAMEALWTHEEAAHDGPFVSFGASWAWPKPTQRRRPPILLGAGGTEKNFQWIVDAADGWITTPIEQAIDEGLARLTELWTAAGREGSPYVSVLAAEPDADQIRHWQSIGVSEVVFPVPDTTVDEARAAITELGETVAPLR